MQEDILITITHKPSTKYAIVQSMATRKLMKDFRYKTAKSLGRIDTIQFDTDTYISTYKFTIIKI